MADGRRTVVSHASVPGRLIDGFDSWKATTPDHAPIQIQIRHAPRMEIRSAQALLKTIHLCRSIHRVISVPAGFRRHLAGKTPVNLFFTVVSMKYALLAS